MHKVCEKCVKRNTAACESCTDFEYYFTDSTVPSTPTIDPVQLLNAKIEYYRMTLEEIGVIINNLKMSHYERKERIRMILKGVLEWENKNV